MSRNDQVTHQWLLLPKLESPRGATLQELAASLSEDFSHHPRAIRRDLKVLEVCFPLLTEGGNGQTRRRLMDGLLLYLFQYLSLRTMYKPKAKHRDEHTERKRHKNPQGKACFHDRPVQ